MTFLIIKLYDLYLTISQPLPIFLQQFKIYVNFVLYFARKSDAKLLKFSPFSKLFTRENASLSVSSKKAILIGKDSKTNRPNTANTLRPTAVENTCDSRHKYLRQPSHNVA